MIILHVFLFVLAASLRSGAIAYSILIPSFTSGFYKFAVSLGILAVILAFIVLAAGFYKSKARNNFARWLHRAAYITVVLAFIHSYWIGSETRNIAVIVFYNSALLALITAIFYRYINIRRN